MGPDTLHYDASPSRFPKFSFTKELSSPRKCSSCQKTMFFRTYRCKHCKYRCHKRCSAQGTNGRRNSGHRTYAGEEHWTKVLQANEVNSNLVGWPFGNKSNKNSVCQCDKPKRKGSRKSSRDKGSKETNVFTNLYSRFCDWVASAKKESILNRRGSHGDRIRSRSSSGVTITDRLSGQDGSLLLPGSPEGRQRCYHTSVSSEDSELSSFYIASYSSTCSNLTLTSNSTATSDCPKTFDLGESSRSYDPWSYPSPTPIRMGASDPMVCDCHCGDESSYPASPDYLCHQYNGYRAHSPSTEVDSCFSSPGNHLDFDHDSIINSLDHRFAHSKRNRFGRTKHPSVSAWVDSRPKEEDPQRHFLCATWPPTNHRKYSFDGIISSEKDCDLDESVFTLNDSANSEVAVGIKESLGDCTIPFSDVLFGDCLRTGRRHEIYRGRWHGEVMIHTYHNLSEEEVADFWAEVTKLSMIRHENIALFMGACLEPPNFAVITSELKGLSLYEQIHVQPEKLSSNTKMNIIRLVAQGMGYLHARGIVIRKLNSKNVYLEPKVKLSMMDYSMAERRLDRWDYGCIPRGNLTYIAPEIMRSLRVLCPSLEPTADFTKATDIYAFGTLLYEVLTGQFPFARMPPEVTIWQIGRGKRQSLKNTKINTSLKVLIEKCWSRNQDHRLSFADITKDLQFNTALHKRHSSSNPEKLSRLGLDNPSPYLFT